MKHKWKRLSAAGLLTVMAVFELAAFSLLAFRNAQIDYTAFLFGGVTVVLLIFQYMLLTGFFRHIDRYLLIIANFLVALGMIVQYRIDPDIAMKQIIMFGIGMLGMIVCIVLMRYSNIFRKFNWLLMLGSVGILLVLLVVGKEQYGAKNWISIRDSPSSRPSL